MDILEFIAAAFWPTVFLIVFFSAKPTLIGLIANIRVIKHGDSSVHIGHDLDKIESDAEKSDVAKVSGLIENVSPKQAIDLLLKDSPSFSANPKILIIESWIKLDNAMTAATAKITSATGSGIFLQLVHASNNLRYKIELLREQGYLTNEDANLIIELRELRNKVAHTLDVQVSFAEARRFAELVETIAQNVLYKIGKE